jgi:adenylate cyclase
MASPQPDFEAEGLLEGLDGEQREARRRLLEDLASDGVPLEELREAVAAGRIALLPVERALAGGGARYSAREIADRAGVELEVLQRAMSALGIPAPDPDETAFGEADLEQAKRMREFRDAGLPEEGLLQVARAIGMATARIAAANRELVARAQVEPGDTERDVAMRFAAAAEHLIPLLVPTLGYALQIHLLEQIRRDVIGSADLAVQEVGGATEIAVGFADMVDFTKLGERLETEELATLAGRLEEMAADVSQSPVRVVKMIGDAAMLVATEPEPLMASVLDLVEAADAEEADFPILRAGVAHGTGLARGGDWYGRPVNLASRLTAVARPGSVLADEGAKQAAGDSFRYSFAGERRLKGIDSRVRLFRVRRDSEGSG